MKHKTLYTVGYEGSSIGDFLATLKAFGIDLLIDVRDVPISRKPGFSKNALSRSLETCDIEYLHLKGLGDPKPGRIAAREGRFDDFRQIFGAHLKSSAAQTDMRRGLDAASQKMACLLCFERDHTHCHRCIVANQMAQYGGFRLVHLGVQSGLKTKIGRGFEHTHDGALAIFG
ncbi:DUF488 domain-containing protein [Aquibium oceanicum]|uniref:DUF488 domain-containing protein n=1 Tax=Aquibium oceanicum TaxID=1670800 RepID=A0A1L3STT2_9HYPH|nr:DUF488 domain-containing protein [Aquibium oceanicum]APH72837.1 hypothetical protein BSQ44_16780 [Aquibium oceanicum]